MAVPKVDVSMKMSLAEVCFVAACVRFVRDCDAEFQYAREHLDAIDEVVTEAGAEPGFVARTTARLKLTEERPFTLPAHHLVLLRACVDRASSRADEYVEYIDDVEEDRDGFIRAAKVMSFKVGGMIAEAMNLAVTQFEKDVGVTTGEVVLQ